MAVKDKLVTLEDLQTAYNDLLEKMEEGMEPTIVNGTFRTFSGVTWLSENSIKAIKTGNFVQVICNFHMKGAGSGTSITGSDVVATVPSGYRPAGMVYAVDIGGEGSWPGPNSVTSTRKTVMDENGNIYMTAFLNTGVEIRALAMFLYIAAN